MISWDTYKKLSTSQREEYNHKYKHTKPIITVSQLLAWYGLLSIYLANILVITLTPNLTPLTIQHIETITTIMTFVTTIAILYWMWNLISYLINKSQERIWIKKQLQ